MDGLASDERSEPNSPFMPMPIFFNINRVLKKLTSIKPPMAATRDAGNGNSKAATTSHERGTIHFFRACHDFGKR
jgi:hypothetical protein